VRFRESETRNRRPHCSQGKRLRCTTEAWLYRLAIRENSAASVTHCFGPHDTCRATTAALSVPVFDAGNISPHLAPLFPARRP
jgi:hypothetical protein